LRGLQVRWDFDRMTITRHTYPRQRTAAPPKKDKI